MTPDQALTELRLALETALIVGLPMLLTVLVVGVVLGIVQAATQINEPTIAFVAKVIALVAVVALTGNFLLGRLVSFTTELFQQIPHLIG